jgi:SAM-dependent methyltransferase
VLDIGCGTGEHALLAAAWGHEATGIDSSPRAIALARDKAAARGLDVGFQLGDALELAWIGDRFDTVIDSGLFHVFDDLQRERYVEVVSAATAIGGQLLLLCFSDRMPGELGPRRVTKAELEASFARWWRIESIEEARMGVNFAPEGAFAWRAVMTRGK